jgi:hypothetical protein
VLRRFPELAPRVSGELPTWLRKLDDVDAKTACIWMLGEFGGQVEAAPYLMEEQVKDWKNLDPVAKLQLLTASSQLFFDRPGEMQPILGKLFTLATLDSNIDVHDRAYLYYRLFSHNLEDARTIIAAPKELLTTFAEDQSYIIIDKLFEEFGTLSVMYGQPSERFIGNFEDEERRIESSSSEDETTSEDDKDSSSGSGSDSDDSSSSGDR